MKATLPLLAALLVAASARADVVLEQKAEGPALNATMTLKIKGDRARTDTRGPSGSFTVLMDLKNERMMVLMHEQKVVMEKDMRQIREQTEAAQRAAGIDPAKMTAPRSLGVAEKVGKWTAEIYEFGSGPFTGRVWVVRDFPNGELMREELKRVTAVNNGGFDPNKLDVPGMIVKYQFNTSAGLVTSTLINATMDPVPESEFVIPQGYNSMALPPISGGVPR